MAAFVTITDGTYTFRITNAAGGDNYGDNFYKPGIRSLTNPKLSGDDYARLRDCTLKIDYSIKDTTNAVTINDVWSTKAKRQLDCTIVLYDGTTAITYTNLKAVRFGRGQTYTYQVVSEKITDDLLTAAPDVKATSGDATTYNDNRYYPRVFGTVKHVNPLLLVRDTLTYYSGGELVECYSRGQAQTVTKATNKTFTADRAIIDPFTMDVKSGSQTSETLTGVVAKGAYLYPGEEVGTPDDSGLYFAKDRYGYYSGSLWSAYTQNTGSFYYGDGGTTIGTNYFLAFYNASNGIGGAGAPDTFVISTPQFEVDSSGNATFSGILSAAGGTFNGITVTANGTNSTATRLTIVGGTAPSSGLTTSTRLDFTPSEDGQNHFYIWNGSDGWEEKASIGISTTAIDTYSIVGFTDTDVAIGGEASGTNGIGVRGYSANGEGGYFTSTNADGLFCRTDATDYYAIKANGYNKSSRFRIVSQNPIGGAWLSESSYIEFAPPPFTTTATPSHYVTNASFCINSNGSLFYNKGGGTTWTTIVA